MKPVKKMGKGVIANKNYSGSELETLPVYEYENQCLSCWKLTWKERFSVLFGGRIWLCILGKQVPVWMQVNVNKVFGSS